MEHVLKLVTVEYSLAISTGLEGNKDVDHSRRQLEGISGRHDAVYGDRDTCDLSHFFVRSSYSKEPIKA